MDTMFIAIPSMRKKAALKKLVPRVFYSKKTVFFFIFIKSIFSHNSNNFADRKLKCTLIIRIQNLFTITVKTLIHENKEIRGRGYLRLILLVGDDLFS